MAMQAWKLGGQKPGQKPVHRAVASDSTDNFVSS